MIDRHVLLPFLGSADVNGEVDTAVLVMYFAQLEYKREHYRTRRKKDIDKGKDNFSHKSLMCCIKGAFQDVSRRYETFQDVSRRFETLDAIERRWMPLKDVGWR